MKRSILVIALFALAVSACTTPRKEIFKEEAPTMMTIHGQAVGRSTPVSFVGDSQGDISGYSREAANEIHQLFPTVANPTLTMFVFPHITVEGNPIPGYTTAFPMYEKAVQFALPGENP